MKRWDVSNLATNVGHRIAEENNRVFVLLQALHKELDPRLGDTVVRVSQLVNEISRLADVVVGAASSRYPLEGTEPYMFEGNSHAVRLPMENACRREMLAGHMAAALLAFTDQLAGSPEEVKTRLGIPQGESVPNEHVGNLISVAAVASRMSIAIYRLVCGHDLDPEMRGHMMTLGEICPALVDFLKADDASAAQRKAELDTINKEVALAREHASAQASARAQANAARLAMQRLAEEAKRKERVDAKYGTDEARAEVRQTKAQQRKAELARLEAVEAEQGLNWAQQKKAARLARAEERKQRALEKAAAKRVKRDPPHDDAVH